MIVSPAPMLRRLPAVYRRAAPHAANWLAVAAVIFFVVVRLRYFLQNAYVPDERIHFSMMRHLITWNQEAFGAAYWVFGHAVRQVAGEYGLIVLRLLAFCSIGLCAHAVYCVARRANPPMAPWILVFVLSTPVLWTGGKLVTGEFYQLGLMGLASYWLFVKRQHPWWVFVLLGFTLGLKVSALPAIEAIVLLSFFHVRGHRLFRRESARVALEFLVMGLWVGLGFVLCSPSVLTDFADYRLHLLANAVHHPQIAIDFGFADGRALAWDYIQTHGVLITVCTGTALCAFAAYMLMQGALRLLFLCTLSLILLPALIVVNGNYLPWHAFPSIMVVWLGLALTERADWSRRFVPVWLPVIVLLIGIGANAMTAWSLAAQDMASHRRFLNDMRHREVYDQCFYHALRAYPDRTPVWVLCHSSYLFTRREEHFCDTERLSRMLQPVAQMRRYPMVVKDLFFGVIREDTATLRDLFHGHAIIALVNRDMGRIYGPPQLDENDYLNQAALHQQETGQPRIATRLFARCGRYDLVEYEEQSRDAGR